MEVLIVLREMILMKQQRDAVGIFGYLKIIEAW